MGTCCVSGSVTIDWMVERSGYVPGESIIVHGEVQNECRVPVVYCKTILYMVRVGEVASSCYCVVLF